MTTHRPKLASLLIAAALAGGFAGTVTVSHAQTLEAKSLSEDDREFMLKAAGGGLFEIEASKMAAKKSQNPEIKRFAAMLVKDHMAASEELKAIAQSLPLRLPRNMPDGEKAELNKLSKSSPAEFDAQYMKIVGFDHHRTDIAMYEERAEKAEQPKVKAFAAKTLPKLRTHLAAAEKIGQGGATTAGAK
jgi:putative membrane protein